MEPWKSRLSPMNTFASMLATTLLAFPAAAADPPRVEELAWLAGCWAPVNHEEGSIEQWTRPAGGIMLGVARTVRNGKAVGHEFVLIRETSEESLEYVASPAGQAQAVFRAVALAGDSVSFENPAHDFPQRISYRLDPDGALTARIEGDVDGKTRGVDFPMQRVDCETGGH